MSRERGEGKWRVGTGTPTNNTNWCAISPIGRRRNQWKNLRASRFKKSFFLFLSFLVSLFLKFLYLRLHDITHEQAYLFFTLNGLNHNKRNVNCKESFAGYYYYSHYTTAVGVVAFYFVIYFSQRLESCKYFRECGRIARGIRSVTHVCVCVCVHLKFRSAITCTYLPPTTVFLFYLFYFLVDEENDKFCINRRGFCFLGGLFGWGRWNNQLNRTLFVWLGHTATYFLT